MKKIGYILLSSILGTLVLSGVASAKTNYTLLGVDTIVTAATIHLQYSSDTADIAYLQLGRPSSAGTGSSCIPDSSVPAKQLTITVTPNNTTATIDTFFSGLSGQYCIQLQGSQLIAPTNQHVKIIENMGTFSTDGTSFGGGSTTTSTNLSKCETTDNSSYCLLAPLPGIGDANGKVDVTKGIGDYLNGLIRLVIGLIGVLAVVMIVVGGIEYMSTVSVGEKEGAKSRITNAIFGLILALSAYTILNTINPNLVNLEIYIPNISLTVAEKETLGDATYKAITGKSVPPPAEIDALIKSTATTLGIEPCIIRAVAQKESSYRANVIGHDENNNPNTLQKLIASGHTFKGAATSASTKKNDDSVSSSGNLSQLLDWRYSHGVGLMQVTFFPSSSGPHSDIAGAGSPQDQLDPSKSIAAGAGLLKQLLGKNGGDIKKAFCSYNAGSNNCGSYDDEVMALYTSCKSKGF